MLNKLSSYTKWILVTYIGLNIFTISFVAITTMNRWYCDRSGEEIVSASWGFLILPLINFPLVLIGGVVKYLFSLIHTTNDFLIVYLNIFSILLSIILGVYTIYLTGKLLDKLFPYKKRVALIIAVILWLLVILSNILGTFC
jgi:hypothetical protein